VGSRDGALSNKQTGGLDILRTHAEEAGWAKKQGPILALQMGDSLVGSRDNTKEGPGEQQPLGCGVGGFPFGREKTLKIATFTGKTTS